MDKRFKPLLAAAVASCAVFAVASPTSASVLLSDNFTYSDGVLDVVGAPTWTRASGTSNDLLVTSGQVINDDDKHDDDNAALSTPVTSGAIYESLTITGSTADKASGSAGDYITTFITTGATNSSGPVTNIARLFAAKPTGTPTGDYRLGVTNDTTGTANEVFSSTNLVPGTTYTVVVKFDFSTLQTSLFINPASESDASVTANVAADALTAGGSFNSLQIRQGTGAAAGDYALDNLVVGTSFADVVSSPEPASLGMIGMAGLALLRRRK